MSKIDENYHKLLEVILNKGYLYEDPNRKDVKRLEISSYTFKHKFKDGFPAITTKKLNYKNVVTELIWFLKGDTNIKYLIDNGCNIWNKDAYNYYTKNYSPDKFLNYEEWLKGIKDNPQTIKYSDLGPVYGKQWRDFNGIDQIKDLIQGLKDKPLGTEHIVNAWNPADKPNIALPPCHYGFQIVVRSLRPIEAANYANKKFDGLIHSKKHTGYGFELHWNQRSVDTFLGLPYNIASYATLALILEKITGYKALAIQGDLKKVHLYDNSIDAVKEQLSRNVDKYQSGIFDFPAFDEFNWNTLDELFNKIHPEDITIEGYDSYPAINVKMIERSK